VGENEQQSLSDIKVDAQNLYREESFTDLKVASIRRLNPIKSDGSPDETRPAIYIGQTHIMSQMGPVPVQGEIDASSIGEAVEKFPQAMQQAVEDMIEEAQERKRQEASRIVVPGAGGMPGLGGGPQPGGGKIHLG
jgi:hypothetical protein